METLMDLMYARRTIREFTDESVTDEQVEAMLKAAMAAPSAQELQPWRFIVVRRRKTLDKLAEVHKYAHMLAKAPLAVIVCGDEKVSEKHWVEDTCVATQNLLLAATVLGLGAVWVGVHRNPRNEEYVREVLGIPQGLHVLCLVPVGHPAESKPPHTKYDKSKVHYDGY